MEHSLSPLIFSSFQRDFHLQARRLAIACDDGSAARLDACFNDGQPEAEAARIPTARGIESEERFEDLWQRRLGNARAAVADGEEDAFVLRLGVDGDWAGLPCITERVADQICNGAREQTG